MKNPFSFGRIVRGDAFCNREQEQADLLRAIENGETLFIYSERRFGKTSLVRHVLEKLPEERYVSAYIDLWPTDSESSFVTAAAKAITESMHSTTDTMLTSARGLFSRLTPSLTLDAEGKPEIAFRTNSAENTAQDLEEVLAAPAKIAAQGKRQAVIVFDEFQQILEYESDTMERRLRSIIQTQQDVSYLFLGSRKHLIQGMILDQSRPLFRAGGHYPLSSIDTVHWLPYVRERFNAGDKQIDEDRIQAVCTLTEGHPFYTQHLFHIIWEMCDPGTAVTDALIETAIQTLLEREQYAYTATWDTLTVNQKRFLKGLAVESADAKPFASDFIHRYGLRAASNVQRVVKPLLEKDLIDRSGHGFIISDRFFRIWIQRMNGHL